MTAKSEKAISFELSRLPYRRRTSTLPPPPVGQEQLSIHRRLSGISFFKTFPLKASSLERTPKTLVHSGMIVAVKTGSAGLHFALPARSALQSFSVDVDQWLDEKRDLSDAKAIGFVADRLIFRCREAAQRERFRYWLVSSGLDLAKARAPVLAAAIEAAAALAIPEAADVIAVVLEDEGAIPLVASIAAQRVRQLSIGSLALRERLANALIDRLDAWIEDPDGASRLWLGAPSLPAIGLPRYVERIVGYLRTSTSPSLLWGLGQGLIDVGGSSTAVLTDEARDALFTALRVRVVEMANDERFAETRPTLIWSLGAIAIERHHEAVTRILAEEFATPRGLSDAAALGAARILVHRNKTSAMEALLSALAAQSGNVGARFLSLMINTGPVAGRT